ncbi:putative exosortase B-associated extracellular polysaccharide biosynthesis transporter EpsL [Hahella aquimaris]|uniref:XrtB/PEP-CTERM-associated polysaccharide biosynthesis outer membrane protein EpsL n=1 Tax=Hahella sp. HNIBRBA332 TaxID=3015983 RepID=UPI00273C519D|nr:XrtB/PEP-CTERM-associated polysaccharide biosynthesis outer membrane protein EpsL [Hahella sp. HNIBRBA332]WLQ16377.1 putative exosortase B-associated extracellular polysaccharide biosynthesis transporter EpsL [Hahella sp. HNIBRBA332]
MFCPIKLTAWITAGLSLLYCTAAQGKVGDAWEFSTGSYLRHEDNLFRSTSDNARNEQIVSTFAAISGEQSLSRQNLKLDARFSDNRYHHYDYLDYSAWEAEAAWDWLATSRLQGVLGADYNESINSFADFSGTEQNIRTRRRYYLDADWRVVGRWRLLAGGAHYEQENSSLYRVEGDYQSDSLELGVGYETPSGSTISLFLRKTDGDYANRVISTADRVDSGFEQSLVEMRFLWIFSGKSKIRGSLGYVDREHDHYGERDYQGGIGALSLDYQWTGSTSVTAAVEQSLVSYQSSPVTDVGKVTASQAYYNSSYYRRRLISIGPLWRYSAKVSLHARWRYEERDYEGGLLADLDGRKDRLQTLVVGGDWTPANCVLIGAALQREKRNSSQPNADFISDMATLSLTFTF